MWDPAIHLPPEKCATICFGKTDVLCFQYPQRQKELLQGQRWGQGLCWSGPHPTPGLPAEGCTTARVSEAEEYKSGPLWYGEEPGERSTGDEPLHHPGAHAQPQGGSVHRQRQRVCGSQVLSPSLLPSNSFRSPTDPLQINTHTHTPIHMQHPNHSNIKQSGYYTDVLQKTYGNQQREGEFPDVDRGSKNQNSILHGITHVEKEPKNRTKPKTATVPPCPARFNVKAVGSRCLWPHTCTRAYSTSTPPTKPHPFLHPTMTTYCGACYNYNPLAAAISYISNHIQSRSSQHRSCRVIHLHS